MSYHQPARLTLADPAVLEGGRRHLERFCAGDPHRRHGYALWSALLDAGAEAVAERLTERGERGDDARETAPSFGGLPGPVRARLLAEARAPLDAAGSAGAAACGGVVERGVRARRTDLERSRRARGDHDPRTLEGRR